MPKDRIRHGDRPWGDIRYITNLQDDNCAAQGDPDVERSPLEDLAKHVDALLSTWGASTRVLTLLITGAFKDILQDPR